MVSVRFWYEPGGIVLLELRKVLVCGGDGSVVEKDASTVEIVLCLLVLQSREEGSVNLLESAHC